ncbi:unnamed protein product [Clonostachys rhizophaga]|uniref:Heterokaryon incompatibility domain-containing protein n=1 Tax=Clonostachys rhizophaga TaxID=160324 RepID=A0A9N9YMH7_9HYPO|nr:unnamed protein product [Clonostachys rhizophaga]
MEMENDVTRNSAPFGPAEMEQVSKIAGFRVERSKAYVWALRDCKFLVYDDTDETPDFSGKGKEKAIGHSQHRHEEDSSVGRGDMCEICSSCPEFPHDKKARKFRLYKPREAFPDLEFGLNENCHHFVAVSYCWPVPEIDDEGQIIQEERHYQVRDLDGNIRANRALDDVIDRAVDVANSFGLRMIWIDQECLPQPTEGSSQRDWDEQQIGVQAMDILYSRAMVTAAFHSLELTSQAQVDAIRFAIDRDEGQGGMHSFTHILDFLDDVSRDRYYERAWVVQESLSAGNRLFLVFRRAPGINYPSSFRVGRRGFRAPYHSLDEGVREMQSEVLCMGVQQFRNIVEEAKTVVERNSFQESQTAVRFGGTVSPDAAIVQKVQNLHPAVIQGNSLPSQISLFYDSGMARRDRIDAAGALTLLRTRGCRDVKDRIAIMANMCGYETRLDTNAVEEHCKSLRIALLTLSILNGDFSLLVPEVYAPWGDVTYVPQVEEPRESPNWLTPFDTRTSEADYTKIQRIVGTRFKPYTKPSAVFDFPAYLWVVEDLIDLTPVQEQWAEEWARLKCISMVFNGPAKGESSDSYLSRRQQITAHFSHSNIIVRANLEIMKTGYLSPESDIWNGMDSSGVEVIPSLLAERVENEPLKQHSIGRIFFGILRCLLDQADSDPNAIGVANSIWQSMRVDSLDGENKHPDLPDEVSEALFSHPDVVAHPFDTLQFDRSPDGQYHQVWLFDRIMSLGFLWVGRYQRSTNPSTLTLERPDSEPEDDSEAANAVEDLTSISGEMSSLTIREKPATEPKPKKEKKEMDSSIQGRQLRRQILAMMLENSLLSPILSGEDKEGYPDINISSFSSFAIIAGERVFEFAEEQKRVQTLRSVFDVDGPCTIATLYNSDWEVLPHRDLRSMTVCWVVEKEGDDDGLPELKAIEEEDIVEPIEDNELLDRLRKHYDEEDRRYRVTTKVKGMWQMMDFPSQSYTFG